MPYIPFMKKLLAALLLIFSVAFHAASQSSDPCSSIKTVLNALTARQYSKVVDRDKKIGLLHYASKISIPGFVNCQVLDGGDVLLFEANFANSNIENNRKKLDELRSIIATCLTSGYTAASRGNVHMWYKKGNPKAGSVTIYDRGNGQFLEIEISGTASEL